MSFEYHFRSLLHLSEMCENSFGSTQAEHRPWNVSTVLAYGETMKWTVSSLGIWSRSAFPAALAISQPRSVSLIALSGLVVYSFSSTFPSDWPCLTSISLEGRDGVEPLGLDSLRFSYSICDDAAGSLVREFVLVGSHQR